MIVYCENIKKLNELIDEIESVCNEYDKEHKKEGNSSFKEVIIDNIKIISNIDIEKIDYNENPCKKDSYGNLSYEQLCKLKQQRYGRNLYEISKRLNTIHDIIKNKEWYNYLKKEEERKQIQQPEQIQQQPKPQPQQTKKTQPQQTKSQQQHESQPQQQPEQKQPQPKTNTIPINIPKMEIAQNYTTKTKSSSQKTTDNNNSNNKDNKNNKEKSKKHSSATKTNNNNQDIFKQQFRMMMLMQMMNYFTNNKSNTNNMSNMYNMLTMIMMLKANQEMNNRINEANNDITTKINGVGI